MKTLKEREVVENERSKKKIYNLIYQKNLYYPYTVRRLLDSSYFSKYSLNVTLEEIDYLINCLENFCHCLYGCSGVNSFNISNVAMFVIASNEELRDEIYNPDIKKDFSESNKILHLKIRKILDNIDIGSINSDLENKIIIDASEEDENDLELINSEKMENIFLNLIIKYQFAFGDILTHLFTEVDLNVVLKFRNYYYTSNLKKNKKGYVILLSSLNSMIYEINKLFHKNGLFLYRMIEDFVFNEAKFKEYIITELSNKNYNFTSKYCAVVSHKNKDFLISKFVSGLSHLKNYCTLEFSRFSNNNLSEFNKLLFSKKYSLIEDICDGLEDSSIYTIYSISYCSDKEILNYKYQLDMLIEDIQKNKDFILITKQELLDDQKKLIFCIVNKLQENQEKYTDICLSNFNQTGKNITFLTFNIKINNKHYFTKLNKNNSDLVWHVYEKENKIVRDMCICVYDLERLDLLIEKYRMKEKIRTKYNLQ